ncbi:hypothetical protein [Altericroceibacterium xinjiangense]|nr:hypothetical protein [Altericroceibacterium xinjiangense]
MINFSNIANRAATVAAASFTTAFLLVACFATAPVSTVTGMMV